MRSTFLHGLAIAVALATAPAARASEGAGVGFVLRPEVTAKDLGVPIYPGAIPRKDKEDDRSGLTFSAWGGDSAFKIAVLQLQSAAPLDGIARFYREALGVYGDVLDCSRELPSRRSRDDVLTCDRGDAKDGALIYKVGLPKHQRLVKMQDRGDRVNIEIVRIDAGD